MKGLPTFTAAVITVGVGILSAFLSREAENHHVTPPATMPVPKATFGDAFSRKEFWKEVYANLTQSQVTIILPRNGNNNNTDDRFSLKSPRGIFDCVDLWHSQTNHPNDDRIVALSCRSYGYISVLGTHIRYLFVHSDLWTMQKVSRKRHARMMMIRLTLNTTFNSAFDRMLTHDKACLKFRRAFLNNSE